jgi:hypothetical protein
MRLYRSIVLRAFVLISLMINLTVLSSRTQADTGSCAGATTTLPFTDVMGNPFFCLIAEAYFSGLTAGTSATTYGPTQNVNREQMAAFITRTLDQSLKRGSRKAAAKKWWQPTSATALQSISVGGTTPRKVAWDGADLWVAIEGNATVSRVRASDGRVLETWTGASGAFDVVVAGGRVFVTGSQGTSAAGRVYAINPAQAAGAVTTFENNTGANPIGLTFDGANLWTANSADGSSGGSITRIPLDGSGETTFTTGFTAPSDVLWDGENLWVADAATDQLKRVDPASGTVLENIAGGDEPIELLFDGMNLWVSNLTGDALTVVRARGGQRGTVLATLTGNGLNNPRGLAFDGERVLAANQAGNSLSIWKAADLTPLGNLPVGANTCPIFAASDGLNFWVTRECGGANDLVRF